MGSTEPPLDLIRNELKRELKEVPLWQQHYDKPQKQVLQEEKSQADGLKGALLTASILKMITHEDLSSEACIKASQLGRKMNNIIYIYLNDFLSPHRQRCSVGSNSVHPPCRPTNIPRVEQVGTALIPRQPRSATAVAATAIHGEDIWPPLTIATHPSVTPTWGTDPCLEPHQSLHNTLEESLLAGTPGTPSPSSEWGQRQSAVFEARTKNPLVDERALHIVVRLPHHTLTSYEHAFAHLPLLRTCHSTPQPRNIILQAPCDLSIPWAIELTIRDQDTRRELVEYQPQGREADLWGLLVNLE